MLKIWELPSKPPSFKGNPNEYDYFFEIVVLAGKGKFAMHDTEMWFHNAYDSLMSFINGHPAKDTKPLGFEQQKYDKATITMLHNAKNYFRTYTALQEAIAHNRNLRALSR